MGATNGLRYALAGGIAAASLYFGYQKIRTQSPPDSPVAAESATDRAAKIQAAFAAASNVQDAEVQTFVEALQRAVTEGDQAKLVTMVDVGRLLDAVEATTGERMPDMVRKVIQSPLEADIADMFDETVVEVQVKRVDHDSEGNLVVYLRLTDKDRLMVKMRWWLYHDGEGLRWWDGEDLQLGLRISSVLTVGVSAATDEVNGPKLQEFMNVVSQVSALPTDDIEAMRAFAAKLDALDTTGLPRTFRNFGVAARASTAALIGEPEDALARLDEVEAGGLEPMEMPMRHFLRASAALALERWDMAAQSAQRYLDLLGEDSEAYTQLGLAELGREQFDAALMAFDKGIADDPQRAENYAGVAQASDDDAVIDQHLQRAPNVEILETAAQSLLDEGDRLSLSRLVASGKRVSPQWDVSRWVEHLQAADNAG